jgi:uncharacterized delta-60 repeat protein
MKTFIFGLVLLVSPLFVFALPGDLDSTFGVSGGYAISDFAAAGIDERPRDSAIQADGKIVVVGRRESPIVDFDYLVARYNADGTLDLTFNGTGFYILPIGLQIQSANAVAIQSDGKIVVAGGVNGGFTSIATIFRLNSNGTLDTSFDTDGIQSVSSSGEALSMVIQTDGKIVVGTAYTGGAFPINASAVVIRLNVNGSLDTTFDGDGRATASPGIYFPNGMALQSDGKIILAGQKFATSFLNGAVVRLLTNGSFDNSFDGDGALVVNIPTGLNEARSVAVQTDGKIIIGGEAVSAGESDPLLVRYNSDGTLDTSFDTDGIKIIELTGDYTANYFNEIVIQPDGKIVGIIDTSFFLYRLNTDGSTDNSFDANGAVKSHWCEQGSETFLQADGKIVAFGSQQRSGMSSSVHGICVQRFNADGSVDTSLNSTPPNGKAILSMLGLTTIEAVAGLPNGKIMVAGSGEFGTSAFSQSKLIRLNTNGTLDTTFMDEGVYAEQTSNSALTSFYDLKVMNDGSFFVAGDYGTLGAMIVKFTPSGVPDTTFSSDGVTITTNATRFYGIAIQPDGKVIGCGSIGSLTRTPRIVRFSASGNFESFASSLGNLGTNSEIYECGLQSDGKIVVAGYGFDGVSDSVRISRHLSSIAVDTTFGTSGMTTTDLSTTINDRATDMVIQSDNKIVVSSTGFGTDRDFAVIRYDANGTLDPSFYENFGTGGISLIDFVFSNPNDEANALLIQPDGQIIVGGSNNPGTGERFSVAKLNSKGALTLGWGTLGRTFTPFPNNNARLNALGLYSTNRIIAAGRTWNGTDYDFALARYENELIPTAANAAIHGRVTTASGTPIRNATLKLIGGELTETKYARTNPFGYYSFQDIPVGQTYVLTVASKNYVFTNSTRVIDLQENLADIDFVSDEQLSRGLAK